MLAEMLSAFYYRPLPYRDLEPGYLLADDRRAASTIIERRSSFIESYPYVFSLIVRILMRSQIERYDAENAVQEALIRVWEEVMRGEPVTLRKTITIAQHIAYERLRRLSHEVLVPDTPESLPYGALNVDTTARTVLAYDELKRLDRELREVAILHGSGLSIPLIAAQLNITNRKAQDLLREARRQLTYNFGEFLYYSTFAVMPLRLPRPGG